MAGYEDDHLSCPQCGALLGRKCLDLLGAGPQALPCVERDVPHSGRKRRGQATAKPAVAVPAKRGIAASSSAGRRTARKQDSTAAAWLALSERRRSNR